MAVHNDGRFKQALERSGDQVVSGQDPAANLAGVTGPQSLHVPRIFDSDPIGRQKAEAVLGSLAEWLLRGK